MPGINNISGVVLQGLMQPTVPDVAGSFNAGRAGHLQNEQRLQTIAASQGNQAREDSQEQRQQTTFDQGQDTKIQMDAAYGVLAAFKLGDGAGRKRILDNILKKVPEGGPIYESVSQLANMPEGEDKENTFIAAIDQFSRVGLLPPKEKATKTAEQIQQGLDTAEKVANTGVAKLGLTKQGLDKKDNMEQFVDNSNQASIDAGKGPLDAAGRKAAQLEFKRAQASEVYSTKAAEQGAVSDFAQRISHFKKTGTMLAEIENTAKLLEAKGEVTPEAKKATASARISSVLAEMTGNYNKLDSKNAIVNADKGAVTNAMASMSASGAGQFIQNALGTESQSVRNSIKAAQPLLINYIRQASEMGARGMDSTQELEFYLQAASDPKRDLQSNIAALILLDEVYGEGQIGEAYEGKISNAKLRNMRRSGDRLRAKDENKGTVDFNALEKKFGGGKPAETTIKPLANVNEMSDKDLLEALNAN